jgi:low affinity Fe/Cu permease
MRPTRSRSTFTRFAKWTARMSGRPAAFIGAVAIIVIWAALGPLFGFSDTWQLVVNTATTIVTFLMVFLIQNTQNRDSDAIQVKLDELIRATKGCHTALLDLEELEDKELDRIRQEYEGLAEDARAAMRRGQSDTGVADLKTSGKPGAARPSRDDGR